MQVKNYIVENYRLLLDCLEMELCKNGISYVRIDNEIHFLDRIIRFYDMELDYYEIRNWILKKLINDHESKIKQCKLDYDSIFNSGRTRIDLSNFIPNCKEGNYDLGNTYQHRNKYIKKQESHMVKQKLKRNFI